MSDAPPAERERSRSPENAPPAAEQPPAEGDAPPPTNGDAPPADSNGGYTASGDSAPPPAEDEGVKLYIGNCTYQK